MRRLQLDQTESFRESVCADCGKQIVEGEPIFYRKQDDIETHEQCAGWWWAYTPEDDMPF